MWHIKNNVEKNPQWYSGLTSLCAPEAVLSLKILSTPVAKIPVQFTLSALPAQLGFIQERTHSYRKQTADNHWQCMNKGSQGRGRKSCFPLWATIHASVKSCTDCPILFHQVQLASLLTVKFNSFLSFLPCSHCLLHPDYQLLGFGQLPDAISICLTIFVRYCAFFQLRIQVWLLKVCCTFHLSKLV